MMKVILTFFSCCFFALFASGQNTELADASKPVLAVEVACGKCKLGLSGKTCDLAVRIDGKAYYADGASIDSFGDAHAGDGMCNAVRNAEVQGELVDNRFKISYIKIVPSEKKKKKTKNKAG